LMHRHGNATMARLQVQPPNALPTGANQTNRSDSGIRKSKIPA
jgi:hypothetical protein